MQAEPNFFQAKSAFSKAFPERRLTLSKLHQLYQDIYGNTSNHGHKHLPSSSPNKDQSLAVLLTRGESSVYVDEDMKKLIHKFIPSDADIKYFVSQEGSQKKRKEQELYSFLLHKAHSSANLSLHYKEKNFLDLSETLIHPPQEDKEKEGGYNHPNRLNVQKKKLPPIEELKQSIQKHENIPLQLGRKRADNSLINDMSLSKNERSDPDIHIKNIMSRIGLEKNKTAIQELDSFLKQMQRAEQYHVEPVSFEPTSYLSSVFKSMRDNSKSPDGPPIDKSNAGVNEKNKKDISVVANLKGMKPNPHHASQPNLITLPKIQKASSPKQEEAPSNTGLVKDHHSESKKKLGQLFESCSKIKENISNIDKKLNKRSRRVRNKLSNLDLRLQKVMKVNFLPKEYVLEDNICLTLCEMLNLKEMKRKRSYSIFQCTLA